MRRALFPIALALLVAACAAGRGVVELTVGASGRLDNVDTLVVRVSQSGVSAQPVEFPVPGRPVTIPPSLKFELLFEAKRRGPISVRVDALDASRNLLATVSGDGEVLPSQVTSLGVSLPGIRSDDMGKPGDGGAGDAGDAGAIDAASPPDLAIFDGIAAVTDAALE